MDYEQLQADVTKLEKIAKGFASPTDGGPLKEFAVGLRSILQALLKDRKEQVRPGQICKDAAAKSLIPGEVAARADVLLIKWGGNVTPQDPQSIQDGAEKFKAVAEKVLPVLKSYQKDAKK